MKFDLVSITQGIAEAFPCYRAFRWRRGTRTVGTEGGGLLFAGGSWEDVGDSLTDLRGRPAGNPTQYFGPLAVPTCYSVRFRFLLGSRWCRRMGGALKPGWRNHDTSAVGDRNVEHCARLLGIHNERGACIELA